MYGTRHLSPAAATTILPSAHLHVILRYTTVTPAAGRGRAAVELSTIHFRRCLALPWAPGRYGGVLALPACVWTSIIGHITSLDSGLVF